ncbi:MAG: CPBP family intramembrane metalloprotease, partial [Clostridiales Family XIII bacterium]|nr:CPBP family intramembrane metalloprotease [Clostridiales Family XIII bacterium]
MKKFVEVLFKIVGFLLLWTTFSFVVQHSVSWGVSPLGNETVPQLLWAPATAFLFAVLTSLLFFLAMDRKRMEFCITTKVFRDLGLAAFVGIFWIGGTIGLFFFNDNLSYDAVNIPPNLMVWILVVVLNVLTQELLLRGYIFSLLNEKYGGVVSVMTTALLFIVLNGSALASGPVAIFFAFASSTLYGLLRLYTGGILAPVFAHLLWNVVGGIVFGGVPLGENVPSVLNGIVHTVNAASGGELKFEGSTIALLITIFLIDLLYILIREKEESME